MKKLIFNLQRFSEPTCNYTYNATINGTNMNDTIYNYASSAKIFSKAGNDTVQSSNRAENVLIVLGDGHDYAHNSSYDHGTTITGNAGNDTLENNFCNKVSIHGGTGNDVIEDHFSEYTTIYGGAGADRITIGSRTDYRSDYDYVDGGADNDYIQSNSGHGTLIGGAGDDHISLNGWANNTYIVYNEGDGNDTITGFDSNDTLEIGTSNYSTVASDGDLLIQVGKGSILIRDNAYKTLNIVTNPGSEITNYDTGAILNGTSANDTITNYAHYANIFAENGNDSIHITNVENVVIDGGEGHDTIESDGSHTSINAGAGDDSIYATGYNNTVTGGKGDDTIKFDGLTYNFLVQYTSGDGSDLIYNFTSNDTLQISNKDSLSIAEVTVSTLKTETDIIVQVDGGYITLDGAASNDTFHLTLIDVDENTLIKVNNHYKYIGGNKTISSYASGEKINYHTDYQGFGFDDTDFMMFSHAGTLTVKNARDKFLDIVTEEGGSSVAYVYLASGAGTIDGSSFSPLEVIVGGDNASNEIIAGKGGSSLWGGVGGYDTLTGDNGYDTFFYGKYDGIDVINNAYQSDTIFLYDVNLSDITEVSYGTNQINVKLNTGGNLQVNCKDHYSAIFQLADGSKYKCDTNTQIWQNA